ncbi:MAG: STAS domain-containing protein [Pseudomonadota bacterium]
MTTIILPAILDREAAQSLASEISDAITQRSHVELDGNRIAKIGQVGIQLLVSAAVTAAHRGAVVKVKNPSQILLTALKMTKAVDHIDLEASDDDK